jgi:hypothetical protein
MNYHQTPEEIIKNASAAQRLLWNAIFLNFGERVGLSQYVYAGPIAGSDLNIFDARKVFVGLEMTFTATTPQNAAANMLKLTDQANTDFKWFTNINPFWNTTAAALQFCHNMITVQNHYFWRVNPAGSYDVMTFIGYKLSI